MNASYVRAVLLGLGKTGDEKCVAACTSLFSALGAEQTEAAPPADSQLFPDPAAAISILLPDYMKLISKRDSMVGKIGHVGPCVCMEELIANRFSLIHVFFSGSNRNRTG